LIFNPLNKERKMKLALKSNRWGLLIMGLFASLTSVNYAFADVPKLDPATTMVITNRDSSDLTLIDINTDQIIAKVPLGQFVNPHMSMVTHNGKYILTAGSKTNEFIITDFATLKIIKRIPLGQGPEHFDISHDDQWVVIGNFEEGTVSIIDLKEMKEVNRIDGFYEPHGFAFLPDGKKALISNFGAHELGTVDIANRSLVTRTAVGDAFRLAALNPGQYLSNIKGIINPTLTIDGRYAYLADGDAGEVAVIDTQTESVVNTIKVGQDPWRAYASPDGKWMLVPNNGNQTVSVIDTKTQRLVSTLKAGPGMTGINFSLDPKKAFVIAGEESAVYVYDLNKMEVSNRLKIGKNIRLETAATTPDGKKIYLTSSTDNSVYVIDTKTDHVHRISDVGQSPWASSIMKGYDNYCH